MTALLQASRRLLRGVLLTLIALVLFIEEWGWRPLSAGLAWFARWPPIARLEGVVRRVPPKGALVLFLLPTLLLFPVKIVALWLLHQGRSGLGLALIVAAKLVGTALLGRLYVLTESQLMQFTWFARALRWWAATKQRVKARRAPVDAVAHGACDAATCTRGAASFQDLTRPAHLEP